MRRFLPAISAFAVGITALASVVIIDNPRPNHAYEVKSSNGRYVIRMRPADAWGEQGVGITCELTEHGEKEIWRIGWYAQHVELSDSGQHLVRYGPWASDLANHTDLAIAFYEQGLLLKAYKVRDLLRDRRAAVASASHYTWTAAKQTNANGFAEEGSYHLVMADKTAYDFDLATGHIRNAYVDPAARNFYEVWEEQRQENAASGLRLYEGSGLKARLAEHFKLENIEASQGKLSGVHFDEPEWRADMTPLRELPQQCQIEAVFPVIEDQVVASLTPGEMIAALERALSHRYVAERFTNGGAKGLRMRITGDRLHWDSEELSSLLKALGHRDAGDTVLRHWAEIIIDAQEPRYTSIFLNANTGELIYEDKRFWPYKPVLVDETGKQRN